MFRIFAVKVSALSRKICYGSLRCHSLAIDLKYTMISRNVFADTRPCVQITDFRYRSRYAKEVPPPDFEVQAGVIWKELCRGNRLPVVDVQNCKEVIKFLLSFHYHKNVIVRELFENTVLLKFPVSRWKETISVLQSYGFLERQFLPLIVGCHGLLHGTVWKNLQDILIFLHSLHISYPQRLEVIARNPLLLLTDDTRLFLHNYTNVLKIFTKNEAQTLVVRNPNLLTDPGKETNKKINYVYNEMGIRPKEVMRSRVFEHPLTHIITRHQFAERAGIYKFPSKTEIAAKELSLQTLRSANPSLSDLVDTSDASFVYSFCSMTVPEYEAFAAMMTEELHEEIEHESENDSDFSDSDSE